jgi:hypothetical protein
VPPLIRQVSSKPDPVCRQKTWYVLVAIKSCALLIRNEPSRRLAAGDVRSDNVKRVASAVGEGSIAVPFVIELLQATSVLSPFTHR